MSPACRTILVLVRRSRYHAAERDSLKGNAYTHTRGQLEGATMEADYAARMLAIAMFRRSGKWRTP